MWPFIRLASVNNPYDTNYYRLLPSSGRGLLHIAHIAVSDKPRPQGRVAEVPPRCPKEGDMRRFALFATLVALLVGLVSPATATMVVPDSVATSASATVATTDDGSVPAVAVPVLKKMSKFTSKVSKFVKCVTKARKVERPNRPVDPTSECLLKIKLKKTVKYEPRCPVGYTGDYWRLSITLTQSDWAHALSQTNAPGRVWTSARAMIRFVVRISVKLKQRCYPNLHPTPTPTPTPTPPPPPVVPAPQLLEAESVNFVPESNYRTISVTGTVAPGRSATLFATADNGGTIIAGKTQQVSGMFTAKVTYQAPAEIPPANIDKGIAQGHDRVTFKLTQDDGQTAHPVSTNQFEIRATGGDPL